MKEAEAAKLVIAQHSQDGEKFIKKFDQLKASGYEQTYKPLFEEHFPILQTWM